MNKVRMNDFLKKELGDGEVDCYLNTVNIFIAKDGYLRTGDFYHW